MNDLALRRPGSGPDLAFACAWWRPRAPTWSYIPLQLRAALVEAGIGLHDVDVQPPLPLQAFLAGLLSCLGQRPWKYAPAYRALEARRIHRAVERLRPRAVLELAELVVPTKVPTYVYQDMNFAVALEYYDSVGHDRLTTVPASRSTIERLAEEQREAFARVEGIFAVSEWYRQFLIRGGFLPATRVHVVGFGISPDYQGLPPREIRPRSERKRILFVGREFMRKGGDWLLAAVERLNRGTPRVTLTVAGPPTWPVKSPIPPGVEFVGPRSPAQTRELFRTHDLFVMPSRFEAYGIVFLEARAAGIPCIGRDSFAMPELVQPGIGGALWSGENVGDLAELIGDCLEDDALHERCARDAAGFARAHTWSRVGERIRDTVATHGIDSTRPAVSA